jgi:hypothetical protein
LNPRKNKKEGTLRDKKTPAHYQTPGFREAKAPPFGGSGALLKYNPIPLESSARLVQVDA